MREVPLLRPPKLTATEVRIRQAELVVDTYETQTADEPLRFERTKPGDPDVMRGFPILIEGGLPGTITSSQPMPTCLYCGKSTRPRSLRACRCPKRLAII